MAKKAKKRKRRKLSSSSSEDYGETSTNKTEKNRTKHATSPSKKKTDVTVRKTKDDYRSSHDEARSKRHIKKPVSRLEKNRSTRGESPIFNDEESKNRKKYERKSSRDGSGKTFSQDKLKAEKDVLIPRSVSVAHKVEGRNEMARKSRWDVLPSKTMEAQTAYLKDTPPCKKNKPTNQNQPYHRQEDSKSKIPAVATSEEKTTATKTNLKTTTTKVLPSQQRKTLKESIIIPPQPLSKKTVVAEKFSEDKKISQSGSSTTKWSNQSVKKQASKPSFHNSFSPVHQADPSSPNTLPNVLPNLKIPVVDVKIAVEKSAKDKYKSVKNYLKAVPVRHADSSSWKTPAAAISKERTATTSKITFKVSPAQQRKTLKTINIVPPLPPSGLLNFKIPKKTVVETSVEDNTTLPIQSDQTPSALEPAPSVTKLSPQPSSSVSIAPSQDPVNSFCPHADPSPWQDQRNVAEELHQARSEKLLEVDVMQSYGELTCMEIDPPEEGAIDTERKRQPKQDVVIVLDTNILLSHLDYVKKIVTRGLKAESRSVVVIPWVVLQELDSLKKGRGLSGSVAHLAIPAISYIWNSLKGKESRLWGQSMQQAAESSNGLNAENNDDRVLQCCLQFQRLYPECAVILCTNDKNLCSKALLSGVKAFSKNDLETEVARSSLSSPFLQNVQTSTSPARAQRSMSTLAPGSVHAQTQAGRSQEATSLSVANENIELSKASDARTRSGRLDSLVCEFESCLQEALSDVLEAEMKAAYDDLWLEIVCRKPPWSLHDVLHCMKKHWIAVFGHVVPRSKQQNVMNLIEFFTAGISADENSTLAALLVAKDLLKTFVKHSGRVPSAISVVNNIFNALQTQGETPADDVVMKEAEEDKQLTSLQVSPCDVWALFENIWDHVFQASLSVFKALDFDPNASESVPPAGGLPPPQDVLLCLDRLVRTVPQLLQAFSGVLTSPGSVEAEGLLGLMQSIQIVGADKLTATDLLNCFSQQEYRERLRVGGNQLLEVKAALDRCVEFAGRHPSYTAQA